MELYLKVHGFLNGSKAHVVNSTDTMKAVMRSSNNKGCYLERQLSQDNWLPAYSIESEDGERWTRLRGAFDDTLKSIKWKARLPDIIHEVCQDYQDKDTIIDAVIIITCAIRILCLLVFDHVCTPADLSLFLRGRNEWAKTLAIKGSKDHELRSAVFERMTALVLKRHPVPQPTVSSPVPLTTSEWVSVYFQPLFMSPLINIADLFASLPEFLQNDKSCDVYSSMLIYELLDFEHPFPLLERSVEADYKDMKRGDQAFFLLENFSKRTCQTKSSGGCPGLRFGAGRRSCPGESLAVLLFHGMVKHLYRSNTTFQPNINHLFSGRKNDNLTINVSGGLYLYVKLFSLLVLRWGEERRPTSWVSKYATRDRLRKYFYGSIRLGALLYCLLGVRANSIEWKPVAMGLTGAAVNTKIFHSWVNVCILCLCGCLILFSPQADIVVFAMYLLKTTIGDTLAGKVDAFEWHLGAVFVVLLAAASYQLEAVQVLGGSYMLLLLTCHQFFVELADARWEHWKFARHRYLYEGFYLLLLLVYPKLVLPLSSFELDVVRCDIFACWAYRTGNAMLCLVAKLG